MWMEADLLSPASVTQTPGDPQTTGVEKQSRGGGCRRRILSSSGPKRSELFQNPALLLSV